MFTGSIQVHCRVNITLRCALKMQHMKRKNTIWAASVRQTQADMWTM